MAGQADGGAAAAEWGRASWSGSRVQPTGPGVSAPSMGCGAVRQTLAPNVSRARDLHARQKCRTQSPTAASKFVPPRLDQTMNARPGVARIARLTSQDGASQFGSPMRYPFRPRAVLLGSRTLAFGGRSSAVWTSPHVATDTANRRAADVTLYGLAVIRVQAKFSHGVRLTDRKKSPPIVPGRLTTTE